MSEKEARFAFPTIDESMDHTGFGSTDESAHKWCSDLFLYYWERAETGRPKGYPTPLNNMCAQLSDKKRKAIQASGLCDNQINSSDIIQLKRLSNYVCATYD